MNTVLAQAAELGIDKDIILFTGLDDALIGIGQQFNRYLAVYDYDKIIETLMASDMDPEEADDFFWFNIQGAYVGENTPIILHMKPLV